MSKLDWHRRDFLKAAGTWAGAGLLQPIISLIDAGKPVELAYPDELLSIEQYTKGRVKPGMVIGKDNADLIKDIAIESLYMELKRGNTEIKIVDPIMKPDSYTPTYWLQATLKNRGMAKLDDKGQLWTKDGKPWIGGNPFAEANTALEWMWNDAFNLRRYDDLLVVAPERDIDTNGTVVRRSFPLFSRILTQGRLVVDPKPAWPGFEKELSRTVLTFEAPVDVYGLGLVTIVYYDAAQMPGTFAYIPTLRRVRTLPTSQRFEAAAPYTAYFATDFDLQGDPLLTWSWQMGGKRPLLWPSPLNLGQYASPPPKREDFSWPDCDDKIPRTSWHLMPEIIMVDGVPHLEGASYSKKRMYINPLDGRAQLAEMYDLAGKLWKWECFVVGETGAGCGVPGSTSPDLTGITFADLQKDYHSNIYFQKEAGGYKFALNSGMKIGEWMTPSALMMRARR